jgi:hypothetical protein
VKPSRDKRRLVTVEWRLWMLALGVALCPAPLNAQGKISLAGTRWCPVEPGSGALVLRAAGANCGGGMTGDGWDGSGQNATTLFWHVGSATRDLGTGQRTAIIQALQAWANVVQITFRELPVAGQNRSLDFNFFTGDHSAGEPQEAGDPDCPFDGPGGVLAHAGFPPGANSRCGGTMTEPFAGNVHFDDDETWEQDTGSASAFSLTFVACHEIGHALGLVHASGTCASDVMRPSTSPTDAFSGLSANDIANIRSGYASGAGAVVTLNDTGVWVDGRFGGTELGTQSQPFNSVGEGANGVPPQSEGVVVHIQTGNYPETLTLTRNMVLRSENGAVTIGR